MKKTRKKIRFFTLIELIVSMAIFTVMMLFLMDIFGSTQKLWSRMSDRTDTAETAQMILDTMERDLRSVPPVLLRDSNALNHSFAVSDTSGSTAATDTPLFSMTLLTGVSGGTNEYDTAIGLVKYHVRPLQGDAGANRKLGCLFRETFFSGSSTAAVKAFYTGGTIPADSSPVLLADNVCLLKVEAYQTSGATNTLVTTAYPTWVLITLKLMDQSVTDAYLALPNDQFSSTAAEGSRQETLEKEHVRTYTRLVVLEKEQ